MINCNDNLLQKALFQAAKAKELLINISKFSFLAATFLFITTCVGEEKPTLAEEEIYSRYLSCYALPPTEKQKCTALLADHYIPKEQQQDPNYITEFQFKAEKKGFKEFINSLDLPCERIDEGPKFIHEEQAYLVKCKPNYQYLMRFNHETKEWKLITGE